MDFSEEKKKEYIKRLLIARMRILSTHGFYGLLLMHAKYALDENCETAYTDGEKIAFSPAFLDGLSEKELDFVLMHEIMHIVLQHCSRGKDKQPLRYNIACDIVVNSNLLQSFGMDLSRITLKKYGESMHLAPDKKEGYLYTAEEVYAMLPEMKEDFSVSSGFDGNGGSGKDKGKGVASDVGSGEEGQLTTGGKLTSHRSSKLGEVKQAEGWDDHTKWNKMADEDVQDLWVKRVEDACKAIEVREAIVARGLMPAFAKRFWDDRRKPQTDWRIILQDFVQQEVCDYSFSPPDRRFGDSPFFLPDYNEKEDLVKDILFMVDTSGSMTDETLAAAYAEVKGAIDQFGGALKGWLGFFDAGIIRPVSFESLDEFKSIKAAGGGGTDFKIIFRYVHEYMQENPPASIIILTDGYAPFPQEEAAKGIPVLWLLNNDNIEPPWGKVARIKVS